MSQTSYRYTFGPRVRADEIEASVLLAIGSGEALRGKAEVLLDFVYSVDPDTRTCVLGADTDVGKDINRLFIGFIRRQFGENSFRVERADVALRRRRPASVR